MKPQKNDKSEEILTVLKLISTRIEDATIDIHSLKVDMKDVKLRLHTVERNTEIVKVDVGHLKTDVENLKKDVKDLKNDNGVLTEQSREILENMVTIKEFTYLSNRVTSVEKILKAA